MVDGNGWPFDHHELYVVAENSGGKKFSANRRGELSEIYQAISSDLGYELVPMEITDQYAGLAIIFAVLAAMGVISLGRAGPERGLFPQALRFSIGRTGTSSLSGRPKTCSRKETWDSSDCSRAASERNRGPRART